VVVHRVAAIAARVEAAAPVPSLTCPPRCLATIDRMLETLRSAEIEVEHRDEITQSAREIAARLEGWRQRARKTG
jgi:hypothetical protein